MRNRKIYFSTISQDLQVGEDPLPVPVHLGAGPDPGPWEVDVDDLVYLPRPGGHDHHPVGEVYRLVDAVGDEDDGLLLLLPDPEKLRLHDVTGLGV